MSLLVLLFVAVLTGAATYLMLQRRLLRLVLGVFLLGHAANVLLVAMGGLGPGRAPIVRPGIVEYVDPLPQALVLTAIVINLGATALLIVVTSLAFRRHGTDDLDGLKGPEGR